ncbi:voltage-dependent T-type calcium channel subunit alpha-1I-like isoform X4 [Acanthopagrus latus]|uniref:voltage-dependent T-type calcium channel subunit alpha-1I-like isoform X4 n=1 Tax=Acanthopagrus latus TaxID=8177 RepID=UPI00187CEC1E|nr:voltage-dependent T-type calcium channel subunit alpha-1I-like isoform X4 [Acanthopagrus latus]
MTLVDGRCSPVQAVHSTAMTGTQEPDLHEQHRGATQEEGDEEEEGEKVHVSVEREEREQDGEEEEEEEEEEEKEELPYPDLAPVVLLALTQTSPPRSWCLRAVCHPWFERVSILAILLNCVTLGMFQPCGHTPFFLQALDDGIFVFFAGEMVVKMVALGVIGQNGYLGDTWNRLDFFIVIVGMLEYSLDGHNVSLSAIRTVRVLRPLRAINRVPSMRILVTLLLDTLPMLGNVLALCFFVFFIFGIVGVQLWAGLLRNRCFMGEDVKMRYNISFLSGYYRPDGTDDHPFICSTERENGMLRCSDVPRRRVAGTTCFLDAEEAHSEMGARADEPVPCVNWYQFYNECRAGEVNPHKGAINFDNIGYAWIAIFQVITLEGWVDIMYYVMDAHSFYNFIYFIFLIIVGSFFMINLCLVVIATQFSETKQREHALMKSEQRARQLHQSASTLASDSQPGSCYEEIIRYLAHLGRKACRRLSRFYAQTHTHFHCVCMCQKDRSGGATRGAGVGEMNGLAHRHSGHAPNDLSHLHQLYHRHHQHHHQHQQPQAEPAVSNGGNGFNYPFIVPLLSHLDEKGQDPKRPVATETINRLPQLVVEHGGCAGHPAITLPGEVPGDPSVCPYCIYYNQLSDTEIVNDQTDDQHHGYSNSCHGNSPCHSNSPCDCSSPLRGDAQVSEPKKRLWERCWAGLRTKLDLIVGSRYFNRGIMIAILINTMSMGIEYHEQPQELTDILEISNMVFTSLFSLEMVLKLLALGLFGYIKNPYNGFDSIIVIISVWEIVGEAEGGLSVLRTFRLLRVLKLVRFLPALRRQLVVLMKTMDNVATFSMLLMLFIFIFSILGMHLFGCKFGLRIDSGDTLPDRKNFDSLLWATVTVFQILTQEDWNAVLYNGMASTTPLAALYFVALMTFGNYVLFNLLVAILVEGFQAEGDANRSETDDERQSLCYEDEEKLRELYAAELKIQAMMLSPNGLLNPKASMPQPHPPPLPVITHTAATPTINSSQSRRASAASMDINTIEQRTPSLWDSGPESRRSSWTSMGRAPSLHRRAQSGEMESLLSDTHSSSNHSSREQSLDQPEYLQVPMLHPPDCNGTTFYLPDHCCDDAPLTTQYTSDQEEEEIEEGLCKKLKKILEPYEPQWCLEHEEWSLYLFAPNNRFRLWCQRVIGHKMFDHIILLFIFLNCITIALERPDIEAKSMERVFLSVSNYIFTVIFVGEMMIKVVAMGLYFGQSVYLQSSWNVLDGLLVFVSLVDILVSIASASGNRILGILRVLRLLRTLRPLRVISRAPGLKLVVETLITSLRPIGNIVLICCAFFIVFGILGVQLFKGKFFYCDGLDVSNITNKTQCLQAGHRWTRRKYNFDNLGQALMSLFVLSCKDGWVSIMYDGLDAVGVDQQPIRNNNPWMLLFFISFLLIVSFFVLNMFVGVVVENFHKCRQQQEEEEARLREEKRQRRLEKRRRRAQEKPYYADYSPLRRSIHTVCTSNYLDLFITIIIFTNLLTMSMEHYNQPKYFEEILKYCNYVFTVVFVIESILKLIAFGLRRFFKERWNQLDLAIVLLSIMGITLEEIDLNASLPINPTIIRIMRVLRITRVLKLLKMATGMRSLLDTVIQALPQVGNLGLLFMLLFFIYAALGVELFGKLECSDENPCEGLSRHATFDNFGMAFLTLFRVSTGDNWNGIMKDTLRECRPQDRHCLTYLPLISPVYFVTFVLTAQFVLVNVVVAVLMKHLEDSNKEAQLEEMEEAREKEEAREREEARVREEAREREELGRRLSSASVGGDLGTNVDSPAQVEDEECSHGNLLSMGRMLSLPSDSYVQPLRCSPYPPIGHEAYCGYSYSGSMSSLGSSGGSSLLQVPGALPVISRASLGSGRSSRPKIWLSTAQSIDRYSTNRLSPADSIEGHRFSPAHRINRHRLDSAHSIDGYKFSPAHRIHRHRLSSTRSMDGYRHHPDHNTDRPKLMSCHSIERHSSLRLSPTYSASRRPSHLLSPDDSLDRNKLSPSYVPDSSVLKRPGSFSAASRQLRRQEAVRSDSLDQSGSADDLAEPHLTVPTISSTPPRQRSSSVHTLKYTHPQRVISCRSHSRSHSETTGQEHVPEQPICGSQPETDVEKRPVSPQSLSSLKVPSGESTLSAPLCSSRAASPGPGSDPGPQLDPADEEVSRINSSVHAHTQLPPSPSHKSRHLSPSPVEHRSRLSQSVSPVSGRNRKQRMSPPPGEEPVITATQLMDSSVELRRRTLSFDATTLSPNQSEGSSVDN